MTFDVCSSHTLSVSNFILLCTTDIPRKIQGHWQSNYTGLHRYTKAETPTLVIKLFVKAMCLFLICIRVLYRLSCFGGKVLWKQQGSTTQGTLEQLSEPMLLWKSWKEAWLSTDASKPPRQPSVSGLGNEQITWLRYLDYGFMRAWTRTTTIVRTIMFFLRALTISWCKPRPKGLNPFPMFGQNALLVRTTGISRILAWRYPRKLLVLCFFFNKIKHQQGN